MKTRISEFGRVGLAAGLVAGIAVATRAVAIWRHDRAESLSRLLGGVPVLVAVALLLDLRAKSARRARAERALAREITALASRVEEVRDELQPIAALHPSFDSKALDRSIREVGTRAAAAVAEEVRKAPRSAEMESIRRLEKYAEHLLDASLAIQGVAGEARIVNEEDNRNA